MSQSASQATEFYREVAKSNAVWTLRDQGGYPAPKDSSGERAQPFWSSRSRVQKIIDQVPAYAKFELVEISWDVFSSRWVPGLTADGLLVGVNWSGPHATGYDIAPMEVLRNVEALKT